MPDVTQATPQRYTFIPRTLTFLTNSTQQLLLIRGAPTKSNWPNLYNGIGGHVEPGETIADAALREIREESGITKIKSLTLRGTITIDTGGTPGILLFIFTGQTNTHSLEPSHEGTPEWISLQDIHSFPLVPDVPHLLTKLFAETKTTPPQFHIHYPTEFTNRATR